MTTPRVYEAYYCGDKKFDIKGIGPTSTNFILLSDHKEVVGKLEAQLEKQRETYESEYDGLEAENKELKQKVLLHSVGAGHYKSERDIHFKETEQFVKESADKITSLTMQLKDAKNLLWEVEGVLNTILRQKEKFSSMYAEPLLTKVEQFVNRKEESRD